MRIVVVGLGNFGVWVSRTLVELGHEVVAIERDGALVDRYAEWTTRAVQGDGTDPVLLRRAGAAGAEAAVVATGDDLASTILATLALRDLGIREIYTKVSSVNEARALEALDVTDEIFPEREAAIELAHRLTSRGVLGYQKDAEDVKFGRHTSACQFSPVDHAAIARACGCRGVSIRSAGEYLPALREALSLNETTVLDVYTDPEAYPPITLFDEKLDAVRKQRTA